MKQMFRPTVLFSLALFTIAALSAGAWIYLDSRLPVICGTLETPGVSEDVRIVRDRWGVPHIRAGSGTDAYFALGFTQAQDRLFQMELQRRLARGELAEILGPDLLDVDKKFRTLMLRHRARDYLDQENRINPEALVLLDAFLDGVNHFIATQPLPVEYTLLGASPRPFTRLDTVAAMGYVAYSFADGVKRDSLYTILAPYLTREDLDLVFPDYTRDNRATVMEPQGAAPQKTSGASEARPPFSGDRALALAAPGEQSHTRHARHTRPAPGEFQGFFNAYQTLLDQAARISPPFTGSNSWVLAPSRSRNGHALLANDPHIGIANPGVWYEAHVQYPGYENYGYHLPLLPFPMLAHNTTKAWAVTMFENDDLDLYAETFDPEDPGRVKFKGRWVRAEILEEIIKVKDEEDVPLTIRITPHGPVVSDFLKEYNGPPVSMSWVFHKLDNPMLDVVFDMGRARTMADFRAAVSKLTAPGLNISYIDREGNIGWWAAGRLPIRPAHMSGKKIHDGGSGLDEYSGYLPFDRNPQMENPDSGMIITANNLSTLDPIPPIGVLTGYFRPSDRAARIYQRLSQKEKWDMEGLKTIQTDNRLYAGPSMAGNIIKVLSPEKSGFSQTQARAFDALAGWDGFMGTDSVGGTIFQFTVYHILKQALEPHIGPDLLAAYLNQVDHWNFLKELLRSGRTVTGKAGNSAPVSGKTIILEGFRDAVLELSDTYGPDTAKWTWGAVHTIEFVHAMGRKKPLNLLYNIGPFPSPSAFTAINKLMSRQGNHDYRVASLPSTRRLIDCNDENNNWSIIPTGNSGNFRSPFYDDQAEMFITGQYRNILFTQEQYNTKDAQLLTLSPR
ncbi:MAG: penicillin acylase family protein [Desulfobacter sp.]